MGLTSGAWLADGIGCPSPRVGGGSDGGSDGGSGGSAATVREQYRSVQHRAAVLGSLGRAFRVTDEDNTPSILAGLEGVR